MALDFLFPLDETASPTPHALSLHWPHLEVIELDAVPNYLPPVSFVPPLTFQFHHELPH
jgi:hypothetical protein